MHLALRVGMVVRPQNSKVVRPPSHPLAKNTSQAPTSRMAEANSGRVRRVLGELVVIVVGVLIALAADSWWQERGDRGREVGYLRALRAELMETQRRLEESLAIDSVYSLQASSLVEFLRGAGPSSVPADSIRAWSQSLAYSPFNSTAASLGALLQTGDINLVRSPGLRAEIAEFSGDLELTEAWLQQTETAIFDMGRTAGLYVEEIWEEQKRLTGSAPRDPPSRLYMDLIADLDADLVRRSPQLRSIYSTQAVMAFSRMNALDRIREPVTALIQLLDAELSERR